MIDISDIHYLIVFGTFFLLLGLLAPLINDEFDTSYTEQDATTLNPDDADYTEIDTIFGIPVGILSLIGNLILLPFWTFGFATWINLWILLPLRIPFWFLIFRNIWVGGGG